MRNAQILILTSCALLLLASGCAVEGTDFPASANRNNGGNNGFGNNGNNGGNNGNNGNNGFQNNGANNGFQNNGGNNGDDVGAPDLEGCFLLDARDICEEAGCLWLVPGCDEPADVFAPLCHPGLGCNEGAYDCPEGSACQAVTYDPCLPQPGGDQCNACGSEIDACIPAELTCAERDAETCEEAGCRFLVPGCEEPMLPDAGCFDAADCASDDDCPDGTTCQEAIYDPCAGDVCDACGATARLCLP